MSLEKAILEVVRQLPADQQQVILDHATELRDHAAAQQRRKRIKGLWADLGVSLSAEEIETNQGEMWGRASM